MRLVALVVALLVATASPASAQQPDLTWCGVAAPTFVFDKLMPGHSDTVDLRVCNTGTSSGVIAVWIEGADPALAASFNLDLDGRWSGALSSLIAPVIDTLVLPVGGERTYKLRLELDSAVTNELANKSIDFRIIVTLTDTGGGGGGAGSGGSTGEPTTTTSPTTSTTVTGSTDGGSDGGSDDGVDDGDPDLGEEVLGEVIVRDPGTGGVRVPVEIGSGLPRTGGDPGATVFLAGLLIASGWVAVLWARRTRRTQH